MPSVPNISTPLLSPEQASPILTGMQRYQDMLRTQLENRRNQATLQYAAPQSAADLQKQLLANKMQEYAVRYGDQAAQAAARTASAGAQQAEINNVFNQGALQSYLQRHGNPGGPMPQGIQMPSQLGGNQSDQQNPYITPGPDLMSDRGFAALANGQTPDNGINAVGPVLPMSQKMQQALAAKFQNQPGGPQQFGQPGQQQMPSGQSQGMANNQQLSPEQSAQQQANDLLSQANDFAIARPEMASSLRAQAKSILDNVPGYTEQKKRDVLNQQESNIKAGATGPAQDALDRYKEDLLALKGHPEYFYPGVTMVTQHLPAFQRLERDANLISASLPKIIGSGQTKPHVGLEQMLSRVAGHPWSQRYETLQQDADVIQDLIDMARIDAPLRAYATQKQGTAKKYIPYSGGKPTQFDTKEEYASWLSSQPPEVQDAAARQFHKKRGSR